MELIVNSLEGIVFSVLQPFGQVSYGVVNVGVWLSVGEPVRLLIANEVVNDQAK